VDAHGAAFDATIPYDASYFESLDRFVQAEPWLTRDKAMIDLLGSIGIRRGHPFEPDAQTRERLDAAAREARALIDAQYEKVFVPPFNEGSHWALPARPDVLEGMHTGFAKPDSYPTDGRGGRRLDGAKRYRLTVPANPPVKLYWSATATCRRAATYVEALPGPVRGG
jgi:hypothetical protein